MTGALNAPETERFRDAVARRLGLQFEESRSVFLSEVLRRRRERTGLDPGRRRQPGGAGEGGDRARRRLVAARDARRGASALVSAARARDDARGDHRPGHPRRGPIRRAQSGRRRPDVARLSRALVPGGYLFLQKPIVPDSLLRKVREVLDGGAKG